MASNATSRDQAPYLAIADGGDRGTAFTRANWGRGSNLPLTEADYRAKRVGFSLYSGAELVGGVHEASVPAWSAMSHVLRLDGYVPISPGCWGGAYRKIRGSSTSWSTHAFLVAADISAPTNPMSSKSAFRTDMPVDLIEQLMAIRTASTGVRVFVWGGFWQKRPDPMHFQIMASPAELAEGVVCGDGTRFSGGELPVQDISASSVLELPSTVISLGAKSEQVRAIQRLLIEVGALTAGSDDGAFGPQTEAAVRRFQKHLGVKADGIWGPVTERRAIAALAANGTGRKEAPATTAGITEAAAHDLLEVIYDRKLGRQPDPQGLRFWTGELVQGRVTADQIAAVFAATDEGIAVHKGRVEDRVREVTEAVVAGWIERAGRRPTETELTAGITAVTTTIEQLVTS